MRSVANYVIEGLERLQALGNALLMALDDDGKEDTPATPDYFGLAQYAVSTLYAKTASDNIAIGQGPQDPHELVVVSGPRKNFLQVASYGTGQSKDNASRQPLYKIEHMAGTKNIINLQGEAALVQRQKIKTYLSEPQFIDAAYQKSRSFFHDLMQPWQADVSFQDAMTYFCVNVIGDCVLGIPALSLEEARVIRQAGKLLGTDAVDSAAFLQGAANLATVNHTSVLHNQDHLVQSENYTKEKAELSQSDSPQQRVQKLLATHGASNLLVESNLSTLIMAGIYYLHQSPSIEKQLREELQQAGELTREKLEKLPYLDCIYKETLRYISPTALITRETSAPAAFTITDSNGVDKPYTVKNPALLFAPIRRLHHDAHVWSQPETFDPSRFADGQMDSHLVPFSVGTRSCPAASHFNPVLFKTALVESLHYSIQFDKPLENIPADAIHSRWQAEYFAKVQPALTNTSPSLSLSPR